MPSPALRVMWVSLVLCAAPLFAEDWPEFRGPTGQGLSAAKGLPTTWTNTEHVVWKKPLAGEGWSSPAVVEGRIYLTSAVPPEGKAETKARSLRTLCLDAATGDPVWDVEVFTQPDDASSAIHPKNSHASPTPIVASDRVYVHFGTHGTAALTKSGDVVWKNQEQKYAPVHGGGGSPALVGNKLIFSCDGGDVQYIVALSIDDGKQLWKKERKSENGKKFCFSTPLAIEVEGKTQVVSPGPGAAWSYDPETGDEIWRAGYGEGYSVIPRPVYGHGLVFLSSGYNTPVILAIRPTGTGDVTESHVAWKLNKSAPHTPSPLLVGDELYLVSDGGVATCLDAKTGDQHWQKRLGGNYSASPIYADGKVYVQSEQGDGIVFKAGKEFEELARNPLEERTLASYAVVERALLIRSAGHLFKIAE